MRILVKGKFIINHCPAALLDVTYPANCIVFDTGMGMKLTIGDFRGRT